MFLVLEYCGGGDLGQYLRRYRSVSEPTARYFMHQLCDGLRELYSLNVLHVRQGVLPWGFWKQRSYNVAQRDTGYQAAGRVWPT